MSMSGAGGRATEGGWGRAAGAAPVVSFTVMVAAHSTEGEGLRSARRLAPVLLLGALAAAPAIAAPPNAPATAPSIVQPSPHWLQIERRIESGYFQQSTAALTALGATLAPGGSGAPSVGNDAKWQSYYTALLDYRLALLARNDEKRAWPSAQRCVDRLNETLVLDPASAEALALQSACLALQSRLDPWRSPLAAPLSLARIDKALKLAPDDPRVLLLGSRAAADRPALFGGDDQQSFALLQRAVAAFERQRAPVQGLPGWGAADAFTDLGQEYLGRGDTLAARDVLERALLVAPEFAQARRLMAQIVSG